MILLGFSALLIGAGFLPTEQDTAEEDTLEDQTLTGSEGEADLLVGGAGNDLLTGDAGEADSLVGGEGDDTLVVAEDNIVTGGAGADTFRLGGMALMASSPISNRMKTKLASEMATANGPISTFE